MLDLVLEEEEAVAKAERPTWLAAMCHSRNLFQCCVLRWDDDDECRFAKFMFALESPLLFLLCELEFVDLDSASTSNPPATTSDGQS